MTSEQFAKKLDRVLRGNADANIRFDDLRSVLAQLGFAERIRGDHHICTREISLAFGGYVYVTM